jgi:hypothetical protein
LKSKEKFMTRLQTLQLQVAELQDYVNEIKDLDTVWGREWTATLKEMQLEVVYMQISAL